MLHIKIFTFKPLIPSSKTPTNVYHPTTSLSQPRASRITAFTAVRGVVQCGVVLRVGGGLGGGGLRLHLGDGLAVLLELGPGDGLDLLPRRVAQRHGVLPRTVTGGRQE